MELLLLGLPAYREYLFFSRFAVSTYGIIIELYVVLGTWENGHPPPLIPMGCHIVLFTMDGTTPLTLTLTLTLTHRKYTDERHLIMASLRVKRMK